MLFISFTYGDLKKLVFACQVDDDMNEIGTVKVLE